jgi:drug/metabolite transporter (DMT)-like permease
LTSRATAHPITALGLLNLAALYVIWSSTYLAIRIAVREDSGFPPFYMSGLRIVVAGVLLLAIALAARTRLRVGRGELAVLAVSALLLWIGGNGLVSWAEQRANSGYAALLVGSMPIWVASMEALLDRRMPSLAMMAALFVGFAGVALLAAPVVVTGVPADVAAVVALIAAPISWGAGSLLHQRRPTSLGTLASAAYQNLIGGSALLLIAVVSAEPLPHPIPEAWAAWAYLVVFGSILGFTAFLQALKLLPMNIAMTYAYVNPVGAVLLGRLVLGEPIAPLTVGGAVLVLLGVAGVFREQLRPLPEALPSR